MLRNCENCRYWSDRNARISERGKLEALCLSSASPHADSYTEAKIFCESWCMGSPIDDVTPIPLPKASVRSF
jgi:hypothetical protein